MYLRFPKRITDIDEVRNLISGDANIKLRRQASRHCHVIFRKMEEKINNMKAIKAKSKENKLRIVVSGVKPNQKILQSSDNDEKDNKNNKPSTTKSKDNNETTNLDKKDKIKPIKKKIAKGKKRAIIVCGLSNDTPLQLVKEAFSDCKTLAWIKDEKKPEAPGGICRRAVVKFETAQIANEYLNKKRTWPLINSQEIVIKPDHRKKTNGANKKKLSGLKIYGDDTKNINNMQNLNKNNKEIKSEADGTTSDTVVKMEQQSDIDETVGENIMKKEKI